MIDTDKLLSLLFPNQGGGLGYAKMPPGVYGPGAPIQGPPVPPKNYSSPTTTSYNPVSPPTDNYSANNTSSAPNLSAFNSLADSYYNDASTKENQYIDSLMSQSQGQLDLALKKLDTQHKLALGNNDADQAKFLESVASSLENKIGRIPYDYQRYSDRELKNYTMQSGNISQNKDLALRKLSNDERIQRNQIGYQQGVTNENTAEQLNSRGIASGPGNQPTGMNKPEYLNGYTGLAGEQAGITNKQFGNAYDALGSSTALNREGVNIGAGQQQNALDFSHTNTMQDLTTDARRGAQDEQNNYTLGTQGANLDFKSRQAALERQRQQLLQQDRQNSYTLAGRNMGALGY